MEKTPDLSLIITALNEEKNVAQMLSRLKLFLIKNKINHEVIFIDDGSSDQTFHEASQFQDWPNLKTIRLLKNLGPGGAIKTALNQATGEWYAWLPCDLEILPEELLIPLTHLNEHDVVATYFNSGLENRTLARKFISLMFSYILNFTFKNKVPYYNGLCLIRRKFIDETQVYSNGFFFHAELLIRTLKKTNQITFVPIRISSRVAGKSKAIKYKVLKDVVFCFLRTAWMVNFQNEHSNH